MLTHGCWSASRTSGSDMPKTATSVAALSSIRMSKMVSMGSFFQSFAISAMVLPCSGSSFGVLHDAEQDRFRAWDFVPLVIPSGAGRLHVLADAGAGGGILQALDQLSRRRRRAPRAE